MSNYADWSNNFSNKYTPYLESDDDDGNESTVLPKECPPGCSCNKHKETFTNMSVSTKTIKRSQLTPTINELDAMYTNIMPPLQIETFENSNRTQYSKKDNKESFKDMGSRLVELTPSITPGPDMVLPQQNSKKDIKETLENTNLAQMSPTSMMMGFTRPIETNEPKLMMNSKETFSNMDMGVQIQKQQTPNMNMDMTYSNMVPSMMSASMMTPPPKKKK